MARGRITRLKAKVVNWNDIQEFGGHKWATGTVVERAPVQLYKYTGQEGEPMVRTDFVWSLPTPDGNGGWVPGEWMEPVSGRRPASDVLEHCAHGLHATDAAHAHRWQRMNGMCWEVETEGPVSYSSDKWIAARMRLVRPVDGAALAEAAQKFEDLTLPIERRRETIQYRILSEVRRRVEAQWLKDNVRLIREAHKAAKAVLAAKTTPRQKRMLRDRAYASAALRDYEATGHELQAKRLRGDITWDEYWKLEAARKTQRRKDNAVGRYMRRVERLEAALKAPETVDLRTVIAAIVGYSEAYVVSDRPKYRALMGPVDTQIAAETDELLRQDRTIEPPPSDPIEINGFLFHTWEMIRGDLEIE